MRTPVAIIAFILGLASFTAAQLKQPAVKKSTRTTAKPSAPDPNRELALRLLEEAEADSGILDAAGRAGLQYLGGETYTSINKSKARGLLQSAYENARVAYDEHPNAVAFMLPDIAAAAVNVAPEAVEQSLPSDKTSRDYALRLLIKHHLARKDLNHAIELLQMMQSDQAMTYAAVDLLMEIPSSQQDNRDRVFAAVLRAYKSSKHYEVGTGTPEDLGTLVVRFHSSINRALVREAIDELLSQAKSISVHIVMSVNERTSTFSAYQFRLFQLLPALREFEPHFADALLKDDTETAALLQAYPDGQRSVDPWLRDTPTKQSETRQTSYLLVDGDSRLKQGSGPEADRMPGAYVRQTEGDPNEAIAKVARISDAAARTQLLLEIARNCQKNNPNAARAALRQLRSTPPDDPNMYPRIKEAVEVAQQLGDKELANSLIEVGLKEARTLYEFESDDEDRNPALKLNWVSTRAYRVFLGLQIKIAPDAALQNLKDLPDTELRALERVAVAATLLNIPLPNTSPVGKTPKSESGLLD